MTIHCNHCNQRVIARAGERCPVCRLVIAGGESKATETAPSGEAKAPKKPVSFRHKIAKRLLAMVPIGLVLSIYGMFGGSFQRRGAGYTAQGSELVWMGLGLIIMGALAYFILRDRPEKN